MTVKIEAVWISTLKLLFKEENSNPSNDFEFGFLDVEANVVTRFMREKENNQRVLLCCVWPAGSGIDPQLKVTIRAVYYLHVCHFVVYLKVLLWVPFLFFWKYCSLVEKVIFISGQDTEAVLLNLLKTSFISFITRSLSVLDCFSFIFYWERLQDFGPRKVLCK